MRRLLLLTSELPYPPFSGGRIKSWRLLQFLNDQFDLRLAAILKRNDPDHVDEMLKHIKLEDPIFEYVERPRSAMNLLKSYLQGQTLNQFRTYSKKFARQIEDVADQYDIILADHYEVFQYIPKEYKGIKILHQHNAEYVMWERFAEKKADAVVALPIKMESMRIKRAERDACRESDIVFAAPNDIDMLATLGVDRDKFRVTYHLGEDELLDLPSLQYSNTDKSLLYVGTLNWEANVDGLIWFIQGVWDRIKQEHPELKFYIVGKNPDERLRALVEQKSGIVLTGFVEDLEQYFSRCRLFLAPLRFGSGIKVKILNAMYRGIPTVTSSIGAEGLEVKNLTHLALADDLKEMQKLVSELLDDEQQWNCLRDNSRKLARESYTWSQMLEQMKVDLESPYVA